MDDDYRKPVPKGHFQSHEKDFCIVYFDFLDPGYKDKRTYDVAMKSGHQWIPKFTKPVNIYVDLIQKAINHAAEYKDLSSNEKQQIQRILNRHMTVMMEFPDIMFGAPKKASLHHRNVYTGGNPYPVLVEYLSDFVYKAGGQRIITCKLPDAERRELLGILGLE